jgi:hypothetical protein
MDWPLSEDTIIIQKIKNAMVGFEAEVYAEGQM